MKRLLRYSFLPALLASGLALLQLLVGRGVSHALAAMLTTVVGMLLIAVTERILPYRRDWGALDPEWRTDVQHLLITQTVVPKALTLVWGFALVRVCEFVHGRSAGGLLPWPHAWNDYAELVLALLVIGIGRYWAHRIGHESPTWWKFHAVHHSGNTLYWLNAGRWNPFDKALVAASEIVPFLAFGMSPNVIALYTVVISLNSFMQHANIDVRLGWLNYVVNSTELHRWHHSTVISESNSNYGNPLTLWDLVFGTFFHPKVGGAPSEIGLVPPRRTRGYVDDFVYPFRELAREHGDAHRAREGHAE